MLEDNVYHQRNSVRYLGSFDRQTLESVEGTHIEHHSNQLLDTCTRQTHIIYFLKG
jgi:hypothetical protein